MSSSCLPALRRLLPAVPAVTLFLLLRILGPPAAGHRPAQAAAWLGDALVGVALGALIWWSFLHWRFRGQPAARPWSIASRLGPFVLPALSLAGVLAFWFVGEWPGHLLSDEVTTLQSVTTQNVEGWLSGFWSVWSIEIFRLTRHFPALALINVALFVFILSDLFAIVRAGGVTRRWWLPFLLLLCGSVPFGLLAIYYSHDVFTAALKLALALGLVRAWLRQRAGARVPLWTLAGLGALGVAASLLRGENVALYVYLPVALWLLRAIPARTAAVLGLGMVLAITTYRRAIEPTLLEGYLGSEVPFRYQATLVLNPVGWIMTQRQYVTADVARDRQVLDAVVRWDCFANSYAPYEIGCFWTARNGETTAEEVRHLKALYVRLITDNPWLFLANRWVVFGSSLGMSPGTRLPLHPNRETLSPAALYGDRRHLLEEQGLRPDRAPQAVAQISHALRRATLGTGFRSPGFWIWNNVPGFVLLVIMALRFRRAPMCAVLAGLFLAPAALVFAASPASHFKYFTDIYIFAFLAIPLMRLEHVVTHPLEAAKRP